VTQGATTKESYTYDPVGNRLSDLTTSGWGNNTSNELISRPGVGYTFDNDGNQLTKVDSTGTTSYTWDYENRLTSVTLPGSGGTVSFKYDPFGRRVYKSSTSGTSVYLYDGDNLVEETNASGTAVARYTQGENIDEPLATLRSSSTSYYEQDGLGTVTSLSSGAGALAQTYTFDSFGKVTASSGSLINPFQFTAREFDPESNLSFFRARFYDPATGRFLSEDPLRFLADSGSFYEYSYDNPGNFIDPSGTTGQSSGTTTAAPPVAPAPTGPSSPHSNPPPGSSSPPKPDRPFPVPGPAARPWWWPGLGPILNRLEGPLTFELLFPAPFGKDDLYRPFRTHPPKAPPCKPTDECKKEWDEAFEDCAKELARPHPRRAITGGYTNLYDCARGLVSEACGGNPVGHGRN
jgi:RHS repeat-associated protein